MCGYCRYKTTSVIYKIERPRSSPSFRAIMMIVCSRSKWFWSEKKTFFISTGVFCIFINSKCWKYAKLPNFCRNNMQYFTEICILKPNRQNMHLHKIRALLSELSNGAQLLFNRIFFRIHTDYRIHIYILGELDY